MIDASIRRDYVPDVLGEGDRLTSVRESHGRVYDDEISQLARFGRKLRAQEFRYILERDGLGRPGRLAQSNQVFGLILLDKRISELVPNFRKPGQPFFLGILIHRESILQGFDPTYRW